MTTCTYCQADALLYDGLAINPPMCPEHFDLAVLTEYMQARGEPVSVESVQARLRQALANGGEWLLTLAQVPDLLPAFLKQKNSQDVAHAVLATAASTQKETTQ